MSTGQGSLVEMPSPCLPLPQPLRPELTLQLLDECPRHPGATGIKDHMALRRNVEEGREMKAGGRENIRDSETFCF